MSQNALAIGQVDESVNNNDNAVDDNLQTSIMVNLQQLIGMPKASLVRGLNECLTLLTSEQRKKLTFAKNLVHLQSTQKKIDWSIINMRHVALLLMYDGMDHLGLAMSSSSSDNSEKNDFTYTVEDCLWEALKAANLVPDNISPTNLRFDRAGRTDKGVSGCGQVISLFVRSSVRDASSVNLEEDKSFLPAGTKIPSLSDLNESCRTQRKKFCVSDENIYKNEIDYVGAINSKLPKSIRILAWSPVDYKFSARHSAIARCYRYIFGNDSCISHLKSSLNLKKMNQLLARFIGTHDFRNICQPNCEAVNNFERTLFSAECKWIDGKTLVLDVVGSAFLYHQIRCIASLCLHVGIGLEYVSDVSQLLDVEKWPAKPNYPIAPGEQLIFMGVKYNPNTVKFRISSKAYENNLDMFEQLRTQNMLIDTLYSTDIDIKSDYPQNENEDLQLDNNLISNVDNSNLNDKQIDNDSFSVESKGTDKFFCSGCVSKVMDYNSVVIYDSKEPAITFMEKMNNKYKETIDLDKTIKCIGTSSFQPVEFSAPTIVRATLVQKRKLKLRLNKDGSTTIQNYKKLIHRNYDQNTAKKIAALLLEQRNKILSRRNKQNDENDE